MKEKLLVLIRHAKSSWADPTLSDFERPLNKRGKRTAPLMGERLRRQKVMAEGILSSPAKRARQTARIIAKTIGFPKKGIEYKDSIYHADEFQLLDLIQQADKELNTLLLVGHNFAITDLATLLTKQTFDNVPTAGVVGIRFDDTWNHIQRSAGELLYYDYPKRISTES